MLKLFSLSSCQYVSTIQGPNCMLPTFQKWTFCKGLHGENDGPSIQGKTARETYIQTIIRSELMLNALQIN